MGISLGMVPRRPATLGGGAGQAFREVAEEVTAEQLQRVNLRVDPVLLAHLGVDGDLSNKKVCKEFFVNSTTILLLDPCRPSRLDWAGLQ